MTSYSHRIAVTVMLAPAAFASLGIAVACPPVPIETSEHQSVPTRRAAEPASDMRQIAALACRARHLASAYLLCDVASDSRSAGLVGAPVARAVVSVEPADHPGRGDGPSPQQ